jgi:hypothetical protein
MPQHEIVRDSKDGYFSSYFKAKLPIEGNVFRPVRLQVSLHSRSIQLGAVCLHEKASHAFAPVGRIHADRAEVDVGPGGLMTGPSREPGTQSRCRPRPQASKHCGSLSQFFPGRELAEWGCRPVDHARDSFSVQRQELRAFHCAEPKPEERLVSHEAFRPKGGDMKGIGDERAGENARGLG